MGLKLFRYVQRNYSNYRKLKINTSCALSPKYLEGPSGKYGSIEKGGHARWRTLALYFLIPWISLLSYDLFTLSKNRPNKNHKNDYIPFEHMGIMNKRFPWGNGQTSLFHNPKKNFLPTDYKK